jgi:hypothetical protein
MKNGDLEKAISPEILQRMLCVIAHFVRIESENILKIIL